MDRMTDTHAHLDLHEDPAGALARAADLAAILTVGIDVPHGQRALRFAEQNENVYASVGLHPNSAEQLSPEVEATLTELARHPRVRAVGETGFDFYWDKASPGAQRRALDFQYDLAKHLDLVLVFHVRSKDGRDDAEAALIEWLKERRPARFVLHAFAGHAGLLETALMLGGYVSFAGNLTHRKKKRLRELAQKVPLERILVETDAPYLTPEPKRGRANQPAYVLYTLAELADLFSKPFHEMEAITDENARRLFRWTR